MRKIVYIVIVIFILWLPSGCYREDLSDCPQGLLLKLEPTITKYTIDEIINDVTLYLFNEQGDYVAKYHYQRDALQGPELLVPVPQQRTGKYTFVVLVNHDEKDYTTFGTEKCESLLTRLLTEPNFTFSRKQADLYHGHKVIEVTQGLKVVTEEVEISKNTNNINLQLEIREYNLEENEEISAQLTGTNGTYDYANKPTGNTVITYNPHTPGPAVAEQGVYRREDQFRTMRLWIGDDLKLTIYRNFPDLKPIEMASIMLTKTIAEIKDPSTGDYLYNTDEKLELEDEFNISLVLDETYTIVDLIINNWYVVKSGEDL